MGCEESRQKCVKMCERKLCAETNIRMWFEYRVAPENMQRVYDLQQSMIDYLRKKGQFGPTLMDFCFTVTATGFTAQEFFPNAAAYETHAANVLASPLLADFFKAQQEGLFVETDALIEGTEQEIAKSPSIANFYPTQKRNFGKIYLRHRNVWFGWRNLNDGTTEGKKGKPIVIEYDYDYLPSSGEKSPSNQERVDALLARMQQYLKDKGAFGTILKSMKLVHKPGKTGYLCYEIFPNAQAFEKHVAIVTSCPFSEEMSQIPELTQEKSVTIFALPADVKNLPGLLKAKLVAGTPIIEAWGEPAFGFIN